MFKEGMQMGYNKTSEFTTEDLYKIKAIKISGIFGTVETFVRQYHKIYWESSDLTVIERKTFDDVVKSLNLSLHIDEPSYKMQIIDNEGKKYVMRVEVGHLFNLLDTISLKHVEVGYNEALGYQAMFGVEKIEYQIKGIHGTRTMNRVNDPHEHEGFYFMDDINILSSTDAWNNIEHNILHRRYDSLVFTDIQGGRHVVRA